MLKTTVENDTVEAMLIGRGSVQRDGVPEKLNGGFALTSCSAALIRENRKSHVTILSMGTHWKVSMYCCSFKTLLPTGKFR
jgi:hypothetical protein